MPHPTKTNASADDDKGASTNDLEDQQPTSEDANEGQGEASRVIGGEQTPATASALESEEPEVHWTSEWEIILFNALVRFRPVGVHKHFRMLSMQRYFRRETGVTLTIQQLWNHLSLFYDLGALDAMADESDDEITFEARRKRSGYPFKVVQEFSLPGDEFDSIISEHRKALSPDTTTGRRPSHDSPRSTPEPHSGTEAPATVPAKRGVGRPRKNAKKETLAPASEPPVRRTRASSNAIASVTTTETPTGKRPRRNV